MNTIIAIVIFAAHLFTLLVNFEHAFSKTTEPEARVTFVVVSISLIAFIVFMFRTVGVK